jgi:hypothetical protein
MQWTRECDRKSPYIRFFLGARKTGSTRELQPAMKRRQAAGGVKNSPRKQPLDGIPVAQEKTILSLAVPEGFAAQNKVPSCLP